MISFTETDWDNFCNSIIQGSDPRNAVKWITERRHVSENSPGCDHPRKREIATITEGKKVFCMVCDEQL